MGTKIDLTGKVFGRLTVLKDTGKRNNSKRIIYLCQCECGNTIEVDRLSLRNGDTQSCGCLKIDKVTKHGLSGSKLYRIWADMLQRCENEKSTNFKYYGARGISVCSEWHHFEQFTDWSLKNGYSKGLSIDRKDVNGNYEATNCRWVTREIQDNNKRDSVRVEINGQSLTLAQVSRKYNLSYGMLNHRYNMGDRGEKLIEESQRGTKRNGEIQHRPFVKLNESIASEVKWLLNHTSKYQAEIASLYGISQTMVSKIKLGHFHKEISERKPNWWDKSEK